MQTKISQSQTTNHIITILTSNCFLTMLKKTNAVIFQIDGNSNLSSFYLKLTQKLLEELQYLPLYFSHPSYIFDYLATSQKEIKISPEGCIQFQIQFLSKSTWLKIPTRQKRNLDQELMVELLQNYYQLQEELKSAKKSISRFTKTIQPSESLRASHTHKLRQNSQQTRNQDDNKQNRSTFEVDFNNPHCKSFSFQNNKIKKVQCNGFQAILGKKISNQAVFKFEVKQINVLNNTIMYGVGTTDIKGLDNPQNSRNFVGCYCYETEKHYPGGIELLTGSLQNGFIIVTEINCLNWTITWRREQKVLGWVEIPVKFRQKPLFPVVLMHSVNDLIELM